MRARRRRSVLNTVAAATLEVAIMGIFVIIAQPQLRDALFEILNVEPTATASTTPSGRGSVSQSPAFDQSVTKLDADHRLVHTPDNSARPASSTQTATQVASNLNATASPHSLPTAPALLTAAVPSSTSNPQHNQSVSAQMAGYSPYDQYESLRISVPTGNNMTPLTGQVPLTAPNPTQNQYMFQQHQTATPNSAQVAAQPSTFRQWSSAPSLSTLQQPVNRYVSAPSGFGSTPFNNPTSNGAANPYGAFNNYTAQPTYANQPAQAATQLAANQWNIASAPQTSSPTDYPNGHNWIPTHAQETSYRQIAPPPYGTQNMWK